MKRLTLKNLVGITVVLVLLISLFTSAESSNTKTIRLGVNLELSGSVAQFGQRNLEGLKMAIEEINSKGGVLGKKLNL